MKAKFLWKRVSVQLRSSPELLNVWSLVKCLIQRDYIQVFNIGKQFKECDQFSSENLKVLIDELLTKAQTQLLALISEAYSSISVQELANSLGLTGDEVIELGFQHGWTLDETRMFLVPNKKGEFWILLKINEIWIQEEFGF